MSVRVKLVELKARYVRANRFGSKGHDMGRYLPATVRRLVALNTAIGVISRNKVGPTTTKRRTAKEPLTQRSRNLTHRQTREG